MASGGEAGLFTALPEQAAPERGGCGLPRLRCAERDQLEWRPVSLDGLLAEDHRVRLVWGFVEGLDLTPLLAPIKAVAGRPGHPPADPRILLALWLYATVKGIGSAREVARLCAEHIAFQWLCGGVGMNVKTLADFRVDHGAVLERLLVDSFTALVRAGVASLDRVAQDGIRVRAAAGAASFRRQSTLEACRREAEQALRDLRAKLDADPGAVSRRQAAASRRAAEDRARRVRAALAVTEERHARQQEAARQDAKRAAKAAPQDETGTAKCKAADAACGRGLQDAAREGATRLHDRCAGAGDEDGRWWLPSGLQRPARHGHDEHRDRRCVGRQHRLRHGQDAADERRPGRGLWRAPTPASGRRRLRQVRRHRGP